MKISPKIPAFPIIVLILSFLIWQDCALLFQTHVATGIDGFYYVLQVNSLRESRYFYFPTNTPFILYFFSVLNFFANDAVFAVKFGAIILQILLCSGIAALLQTITKNTWLTASGIFLLTFSVLHLYFLSEFLSNLGALAFLIWGAFGVVKTIQTEKKIWLIFAGLTFLAAIFSHRSSVWLVVWLFFAVLFSYLWLNYATNTKKQFTFGLIILVLFISPCVLAWQPFFALPEWLLSELSKYPQSPVRPFVLMESLMLLIVSMATLSILFAKPEILRKNLSGLILLSIVVWSLLVTLNPFLNHQTGISGIVARFDALAYLQAAIAVPLLLSLLISCSKKLAFLVAMLLLPLLVLRWFVPLPIGLRPEFLQTREKLVRELPLMRSQICEKPFIIAQHGEQFLVTAFLGIPSQRKPPLENQFQCVFWLIHQRGAGYQIIFDKSVTSSDGGFTLVEDSEMRRSFEMMPVEERSQLISENSHLRFISENSTR